MRRSLLLATPLLLVGCVPTVWGQTPPEPPQPAQPAQPAAVPAGPCPRIDLQNGAQRILRDGESFAIVANLSGGDANVTPTYVWSTTAGSIKGGQGTRHVEVDSTGAGEHREMVVELWVGGYAAECTLNVKATVKVAGPATKVDEFGELTVEKENERLNAFASAVAETGDNVYVFAYAGRSSVRNYAVNAVRRIKAQLVAAGIPAGRLSTLDGGFREAPAYELWVVPAGAQPPKATPTIDRKEIVYPKATPAPVKKP